MVDVDNDISIKYSLFANIGLAAIVIDKAIIIFTKEVSKEL